MIEQFKKFILRGNLVELAIGFTVGAAFSTVAKSLVTDIIMPPIGLLIGRVDFEDLFWVLREGETPPPYNTIELAQEAGAVTLNWGLFVNNLLALLVVAIAMFVIVRVVNKIDEELDERLGDKKEPGEPETKKCGFCRSQIPYRASRCPQCTSELDAPPAPAAPKGPVPHHS